MRNIIPLLLIGAALAPQVASAQNTDVVVMRRQVAPASEQLVARWREEGDWTWTAQAPTCGSGEQRQKVTCVSLGKAVDPSRCAATPAPSATRMESVTTGCTFDYAYGTPDAWPTEACDARATRNIPVTCRRSDGVDFVSTHPACAAKGAPVTTETTALLAGCGYQWTQSGYAWTSTCSVDARYQQTIGCGRTAGAANDAANAYPAGGTAPVDMCTSHAGARPPENDGRLGNYAGCTGSWSLSTTDVTQCVGGTKRQTTVATCSSGNMCDPRTRPTTQEGTRDVTCTTRKVTCTVKEGDTLYGDGSVVIDQSGKFQSLQEAVDYCENLSDQGQTCNVTYSPAPYYTAKVERYPGTISTISNYAPGGGWKVFGGRCTR